MNRLLLVAAVLLVPGTAMAQAQQHSVPDRTGIVAGISLGAGVIAPSCDGCESVAGPAVQIQIGWGITDRLALVYDGSAVVHTDNGLTGEASMVLAGAAQYWVGPRLWLKAGVGLAQLERRSGVFGQKEQTLNGLGIVAGAGYELHRAGRFVFDAHARVTTGLFDDGRVANASAVLGVNWY